MVKLSNIISAAGVSRSASLVIAYLMKENNWKYEESFKFVKSKRSKIFPNLGFTNQLKCYEITLGIRPKEEINENIITKKYELKTIFDAKWNKCLEQLNCIRYLTWLDVDTEIAIWEVIAGIKALPSRESD